MGLEPKIVHFRARQLLRPELPFLATGLVDEAAEIVPQLAQAADAVQNTTVAGHSTRDAALRSQLAGEADAAENPATYIAVARGAALMCRFALARQMLARGEALLLADD